MPRNQCLLLPSIYTVYIQLLNQSSATISVFFRGNSRNAKACSHWWTKMVVLPLSNFLVCLHFIWFNQCASAFPGTHFPRSHCHCHRSPFATLAFSLAFLFLFNGLFICIWLSLRGRKMTRRKLERQIQLHWVLQLLRLLALLALLALLGRKHR